MSPKPAPIPARTRRIGLFGGTFDPPHLGHISAGQRVGEVLGLDEVHFVVANDPWQKSSSRNVTPAAIRMKMVEQVCHWSRPGRTALIANDVEIRTGGPSYTADTVRALRAAATESSFVVIVGSDAGAGLHTWSQADWLRENVSFVAVHRGGQGAEPSTGFDVRTVDAPLLEISSTEIRQRVAAGLPLGHLCHPAVEALIAGYGLYAPGPTHADAVGAEVEH